MQQSARGMPVSRRDVDKHKHNNEHASVSKRHSSPQTQQSILHNRRWSKKITEESGVPVSAISF